MGLAGGLAANGGATNPGASVLSPVATVTSAGALAAGKHNPVDATSAPLTMTLPTGQALGTLLGVEKEDASANAVTVSGSIRGGASTNSLAAQFRAVLYVADSAGSWWPISDIKPLAFLNTLYGQLTGATFTGEVVAPDVKLNGLTGATAATRFVGATASGAPVSGTFAKGDFIIDQSGAIWVCTAAGTSGTWVQAGGAGGGALNGNVSGPGGTAGANTGSAVTVASPSGFALWWAVLNAASVVITLPAASAGQRFVMRLDQDATGGRAVTFAGSPPVNFPGAQLALQTGASAQNWISFECADGVNWNAFPITSAAAAVIGTTLQANGAQSVTTTGRFIGYTSGTGAPGSGTWNTGDFTIDSTGAIFVCTAGGAPGTWAHASGGSTTLAADTDVLISSPADGDRLTYEGSSSKWKNKPTNYLNLFGDGSDGALTFDGTTTLTIAGSSVVPSGNVYTLASDINATAITINNGVTLLTADYRIKCQGTVTNGGTISAAGNNAVGATAGQALGAKLIGGGAVGKTGGTGVGTSATGGVIGGGGGTGGASGASGGNNAGGGSASQTIPASLLRSVFVAPAAAVAGTIGYTGSPRVLAGGGGGASGGGDGVNSAGAGGGGASSVFLFAHALVNNGTITANGGNGGNAAAGNCGGGGGGGGVVVTWTLVANTGSGSITVAAGTHGTGIGTGVNGGDGQAGTSLAFVLA